MIDRCVTIFHMIKFNIRTITRYEEMNTYAMEGNVNAFIWNTEH